MQVHNAREKNTSCNLGVYFYIFLYNRYMNFSLYICIVFEILTVIQEVTTNSISDTSWGLHVRNTFDGCIILS